MAVVMIQKQPEMFRTEMYDAVNAKMGTAENPPDGLITHTLGQGEDGVWRIVDVWESREAFERFASDRLRPALAEVMRENGMDPENAPEPEAITYETYDLMTGAAR